MFRNKKYSLLGFSFLAFITLGIYNNLSAQSLVSEGVFSVSVLTTPVPIPTPTPTVSVSSGVAANLSQTGGEQLWINPDNAKACDNVDFTSVSLPPISDSNFLVGTDLGFSADIPPTATIIGVAFSLPNYYDAAASGIFSINAGWRLELSGVGLGSYRFQDIYIDDGFNAWTDGDGTSTLGFSLDAATVRSSTFGYSFKFGNTDAKVTMEPAIDCITVYVYWRG